MKLSVCILTKNEEKNIERCLENVKDIADEIIIVDDFSSDRTIEICRKYTDKIFKRELKNDFSAQRNYAISKATGDWILMIDPDELVTQELKEKIKKLIENKEIDCYKIKFLKCIGGKYIKYGFGSPEFHLRLFKKGKAAFKKAVHEIVEASGNVKSTDFFGIIHYGEELLPKEKIARQLFYAKLEAKEGSFLKTILAIPYVIWCFFSKKGFLDGWLGVRYHFYKIWYYGLVLKYLIDFRSSHH